MELIIPTIKKMPLKEYLEKEINKGAYNFYHQDLKPKYGVKIEDFQKFLEETYSLLGILYFNYYDTPYSVKEYFGNLNKKKLQEENPIINAFQYNIIWTLWVDINGSWDSRPDLVSFSEFTYLTIFFPLASKEATRIKGEKVDFANEDLDRFYRCWENEDEFMHVSGYKKTLDFLYYLFPQANPQEQKKDSIFKPPAKVKNNLTQSELLEVIKALKLTGKITGNNKNIIDAFSHFFSIDIKNPDQIINGFKGRNNGSETLFLDELKTALFDYTKQ